jgi:predicted Zn-dependent protease
MARCFEKLNKRGEMIVVLQELQRDNPSNVPISLLLADLLMRDKKTANSIEILSGLIKNNAKVPQVFAALAKLKVLQSDTNGALVSLQEGLGQNPDDIHLTLALAALYETRGENDLAKSVYEGLLVKNPNLDAATNSLAVLLTEHYDNADILSKAVQLAERFKDSDQPYYRDTYAWALIKQGRNDEGITVLQDVITRAPDVPVFRYHLGFAYAKSENNGSAIAELQQALELASKNQAFPEQNEARLLVDKLMVKTRGH